MDTKSYVGTYLDACGLGFRVPPNAQGSPITALQRPPFLGLTSEILCGVDLPM